MPNDPFYQSKEWRKLSSKIRAWWLWHGHHCAFCDKPIQKGERTVVDHVLPRKKRPDLALDPSNLVVQHHRCHSQKTTWVDHADPNKEEIGEDGFPASWK